MKNNLIKIVVAFIVSLGLPAAFAYQSGTVTKSVLGVTSLVGSTAIGFCYILGVGFLVATLVQYKKHRENPVQVPISRVFFYLILGLILLLIPLIGTFAPGSRIG